jgi:hypothetical protein
MKKELQKKLNVYAAAAGTLAVAGAANAQVVYTDINPDTVLHDSLFYNLNMDNAGLPEFRFETIEYQLSSGVANIAAVGPISNANNAILGSLYSSSIPVPFSMNNGDSISGTNANWQDQTVNGGAQYLAGVYGSYSIGNWIGVNDKYMGVRFRIGTNTHYGWVRLSVSAGADTITIKDYAYQTLPGVGITAGQLVGLPKYSDNQNISIFASQNTVVLRNTEHDKGGIVRIVNTMGETISETAITEENMRISLDGKAAGIYFVEVLRNDERFTKKVYIH